MSKAKKVYMKQNKYFPCFGCIAVLYWFSIKNLLIFCVIILKHPLNIQFFLPGNTLWRDAHFSKLGHCHIFNFLFKTSIRLGPTKRKVGFCLL